MPRGVGAAQPLTIGDREIRPLTADDVLRMVAAGILSEDEPVELLHGALTRVSPKSPAHGAVLARLVRWLLASGLPAGLDVRTEHPLVVPDRTSLPEPDVAVVVPGGDPHRHPTSALLVVEVSVSSLRADLSVKPALYAAAGVPELWVVDVPGRRVERFRDPDGRHYASRSTHVPPERLRPVAVDVPPLDLGELLAGL